MRTVLEIKQSATPNALDIFIYDDVKSDSYDWWTGEKVLSDTSANFIKEKLEGAGELSAVNIYINSFGGSVKEGLGIYNQLKRCKAYKTVYIDGFACSIASVIAMAGDKVVMPKNTLMMIHNAWTVASGNAQELRKAADDLEIINEASTQSYLMKAGDKLDKETLKAMLDAETWLTAEQCVSYGLVDELSEQDLEKETAMEMLEKVKQSAVNQTVKTIIPAAKGKAIEVMPMEQKPTMDAQKLINALMASL